MSNDSSELLRRRRVAFLTSQARLLDHRFRLAPGEELERQKFERLAIATYDSFAASGVIVGPFDLWADFSDRRKYHVSVGEICVDQWKEWTISFKELLERNPRLEVYDMMHQIGESHQAASWPYYMEETIQDWLDSGDISAVPFLDSKGIITPEFYNRLRELRTKIGGWLYWRDTDSGVVFVREEKWQQMRLDPKYTIYLVGRNER
jgi:hypothetical protein